ncbi:MAG: c-type cytochrome [Bdellovibrionales bacterium]|nr:c-type cytochrome [Bdellovibrionales bacterium]
MSNEKDQVIEGHSYDGIQELNNPLPGGWLATFYITIVFAIGYYGYYEVLDGPSQAQQLEMAMAKIKDKQKKVAAAEASKPSGETEIDLAGFIADTSAMKTGEEHYKAKCAACHGQMGEGLIGPNLTDKYWIHSQGQAPGLLSAIRKGFPTKGMPPWDAIIPKKDQVALAAYVFSLQGTNPSGGKEPQGELID